jgi:hypothetical protein
MANRRKRRARDDLVGRTPAPHTAFLKWTHGSAVSDPLALKRSFGVEQRRLCGFVVKRRAVRFSKLHVHETDERTQTDMLSGECPALLRELVADQPARDSTMAAPVSSSRETAARLRS